MPNTAEHWNTIFANKPDQELGWYEQDVSQTLKFITPLNVTNKTVFLPGAGTSNLVEHLAKESCNLVLNDISHQALNKLKSKIVQQQHKFICADISKPFETSLSADIWVDRAVLHFLLTEKEISQYFHNLKASVKVGGHVLLAEFSIEGAPKCAGLELHRYSLEELCKRLGEKFELVSSEDYVFKTPAGLERPYIYAFFKRVG